GKPLVLNGVDADVRLEHVAQEGAQTSAAAADVHDPAARASPVECARRGCIDHIVARAQALPGPGLEREVGRNRHAAVGIPIDEMAFDSCSSTRAGSHIADARPGPAAASEARSAPLDTIAWSAFTRASRSRGATRRPHDSSTISGAPPMFVVTTGTP